VRVVIFARPRDDRAARAARDARDLLLARGAEVFFDPDLAELTGLDGGVPRAELAERADLAVALGGDGTQLAACRLFSPRGVPVFGVNLGRLGFLTDVGPDQMLPVLERVLRGEFEVEERLMLSGEVVREDGTVLGPYDATNDLVVNKGALAQIVRIETRVDGAFVSSYLADGIIFATPTGSTAYGLAVGGPIVTPDADVVLIAPICPHVLTNRPIIVPGGRTVEARIVETRGEVYLTIDGQEGFELRRGDRLRARRSPHRARLVRAGSADFFAVLRRKMSWGGG
jgi:NAD+ kinase